MHTHVYDEPSTLDQLSTFWLPELRRLEEMKDQGVGEDRLLLLKGVSRAFEARCSHSSDGCILKAMLRFLGIQRKKETFARIFGYCEQNDIHSPHVTVYESLVYSSWLRLASDIDEHKRKVMDLMELITIKDALVKLLGVNGLSTNQRKMLTITVELVASPSILFMDEPTLELDARAAAIVMRIGLQPL
ncbi:putative ABC transporter, P-loop containing nucleoside triphosphate hydrolase [Helianthus anomalus]